MPSSSRLHARGGPRAPEEGGPRMADTMRRSMPSLRIRVAGQTFEAPLPEGPVRIGTDPACDLTLACEGVAREHCVLEPMAGGAWRLKDLSSGRPTLVNGTE